MSRCGYSDDIEPWALIRWRGAVKKAIKGKRGQAFLRELLETLDSMPEKKLISGNLVTSQGEVCAIGSVMSSRGMDASQFDVYDSEGIADKMGISNALVKEVEYINDKAYSYLDREPPDKKRFEIVRNWVVGQINEDSIT